MLTNHQSQYIAWQLTRRLSSEDEDKLTGAIMDAQIDLNPHQVDAALFAFKNPLEKGVLLADEVGLGKTIEAGLVIAQKWAERRRRILIIVPANLRKQWHQELQEKFGIEGQIIETKNYNNLKKQGVNNPFDQSQGLFICSYHFAKAKSEDIQMIPWDLAIIDEAHRLRNVYKKSNKIAKVIKDALAPTYKILLTATPLQNSLLELYGLASVLDERVFGDLESFRLQYGRINDASSFAHLKQRLAPICKRTLRRQVEAYIPYTRRIPLVERFTPSIDEQNLTELVCDYLRRPNLQALPSGPRQLISMVLWKLLASSSFAIGGAIGTIVKRLEKKLSNEEVLLAVEQDFEGLDETLDEWNSEENDEQAMQEQEKIAIQEEINELKRLKELAENIRDNAKGIALLKALKIAFAKLEELGAERKAIIFTESRRTQDYLQELLETSEYNDGIVLFNGTNSDSRAKEIYKDWLEQHSGTDKITGSKTADTRAALVDYFRERGKIMIATEAGAEGINLQFCSLLINYDLPWNPQRIEQRIGRCHRYGQKYDVVVLNFIDLTNEADKRVYELLEKKFNLFEGVFGASDEVLGAIESGVDFERRIATIYQTCREPEQIRQAFEQLQSELSHEISQTMLQTRQQLLENLDEEVVQRLKLRDDESKKSLSKYEEMLLSLSETELQGYANFYNGGFTLNTVPENIEAGIPTGKYELPRRSGEAHIYRLGHPLAQWVLNTAKHRNLQITSLTFDYNAYKYKVSLLEELKGKKGWLQASVFSVEALDREEDYVIVTAQTDLGEELHKETAEKLLSLPVMSECGIAGENQAELESQLGLRKNEILKEVNKRNLSYFEAEVEKLDAWADDLKVGLEQELKEIDREIKEIRRSAKVAADLEEKLHWQKKQRELEKIRNKRRRELFDKQDEVDESREKLIGELEGKLEQKVKETPLFTIRWELV